MRFRFLAIVTLTLAACDQGMIAEPEASWTGSIGRLVADGGGAEGVQFRHLDGVGPAHGQMTLVTIDDADVDEAVRLQTLGQPPRMESLQAHMSTIADIEAGAACWLHFDARALEPQLELGLGRLAIEVRPTAPDLPPLLDRLIYLGPDWTPIDLSFSAPDRLDAGEAEVILAVGTQLQVVDIGGISMRCFGEDSTIDRLPETTFSYDGREAEAIWRATANSQIERYRKGDLTIEVTDAGGQPVADAEIHIQMVRHAFQFGAAIDAADLAGGEVSDDAEVKTASYRKNLKELFNTVTFENGLSWTSWADETNRRTTKDALAWVRSLGLDLRGRGLVSIDQADLPSELEEKRNDPDEIREAIRAGITSTAGELDGSITAWNVVDRPREGHDLLDFLGWDELAIWFQLARSAAPEAKLLLNESDILAGDRIAQLATLLEDLISKDAPIDRIGVQGQFAAQPPPIQVLSDRLDQLASFDLPLVITAFDMATSDQQLQRDFARDFLTLAFSHPSVEGFVFGQFWQEDDAAPGVAMYRRDGTISPIGKTYRDLVLGDWWSDIVALSNAEGELISRVFRGDYMISARKDDQSATATLSLGPDGATVNLTLAAKDDSERAL